MNNSYPRDLYGYGANPPNAAWPNAAKIAVQFVLNYEEGGENCLLHGDAASEAFLSEIVGAQPFANQRHWNMESLYEYGARAGFWRLHRLFTSHNIPITVYGVATALARSPDQVMAMQQADWEIASHAYKWIEYKDFTLSQEAEHMQAAIGLHTQVTGSPPLGWYTGRCSMHTVELAAQSALRYVADSYADDLPYWHPTPSGMQLIVPYSLDCNDMRFATAQGFNSGSQFYDYLKDSFDCLYAEGQAGQAKMLSVGLHCRLIGKPGRIQALKRFIEYAQSHDHVWFAKRIDIAEHWHQVHSYRPPAVAAQALSKEGFVALFGSVFEHSAWVAEQAFDLRINAGNQTAIAVHNGLCRAFRAADDAKRLAVLQAHPDLAGKLAQASLLTEASNAEQASAGLDQLTQSEKDHFISLNSAYTQKFGFPFIIAVRDYTKAEILQAFEARLRHSTNQEFATACTEVERIALHRLCALYNVETPHRPLPSCTQAS